MFKTEISQIVLGMAMTLVYIALGFINLLLGYVALSAVSFVLVAYTTAHVMDRMICYINNREERRRK